MVYKVSSCTFFRIRRCQRATHRIGVYAVHTVHEVDDRARSRDQRSPAPESSAGRLRESSVPDTSDNATTSFRGELVHGAAATTAPPGVLRRPEPYHPTSQRGRRHPKGKYTNMVTLGADCLQSLVVNRSPSSPTKALPLFVAKYKGELIARYAADPKHKWRLIKADGLGGYHADDLQEGERVLPFVIVASLTALFLYCVPVHRSPTLSCLCAAFVPRVCMCV